jgi:hypothetical protein
VPSVAHADLSAPRLLRLLDGLDRTGSDTDSETIAVPAGETLPHPVISFADELWDSARDYAGRSEIGTFAFVRPDTITLVVPPYPIAMGFQERGARTEPLRELLANPYRIGVVLLRLGGYAVGVYDGGRLVESRNDSRFVKNRHRKGGQSQRRFDRIREKQVHELFEKLCADAQIRLGPHAESLDFVVYGGDRHTVQAFLQECRFLREIPIQVLPRFLTVPEPRHETLERLPSLLTTSRVTTIEA